MPDDDFSPASRPFATLAPHRPKDRRHRGRGALGALAPGAERPPQHPSRRGNAPPPSWLGRPRARDRRRSTLPLPRGTRRSPARFTSRLVQHGSRGRERQPMPDREGVRCSDQPLRRREVPDPCAHPNQVREEVLSVPRGDVGRAIDLLDQLGDLLGLSLRKSDPPRGDGSGHENLKITNLARGFHEVGDGGRRLLEPPAEEKDLRRPGLCRDDLVRAPGPGRPLDHIAGQCESSSERPRSKSGPSRVVRLAISISPRPR